MFSKTNQKFRLIFGTVILLVVSFFTSIRLIKLDVPQSLDLSRATARLISAIASSR